MGTALVITAGYLNWDTAGTPINLSPYIKSISANFSIEELDSTTMFDTTTNMIGGLNSHEITVEFNHDPLGVLENRLWADRGVARAFELRASSGAVSAANPRYTGTAAFFAMALPPNGAHGVISTTSITLKPSGTAPTLVRATS